MEVEVVLSRRNIVPMMQSALFRGGKRRRSKLVASFRLRLEEKTGSDLLIENKAVQAVLQSFPETAKRHIFSKVKQNQGYLA